MKRKILFRGKWISTEEWVYGDLIHYDNGDIKIMPQICREWDIQEAGYRVIPKTVGQYTGLKDKNGVRIFEGDEVYIPGGEEHQGMRELMKDTVVECSTMEFNFVDSEKCHYNMGYCSIDEIEITGNIDEQYEQEAEDEGL